MKLSFTQLLKGSVFNVISKIAGANFSLIAHFMITAQYGAGLIGTIATITSAFSLLSIVFLFGNQTLVLKLIPQFIEKYNHSAALHVYKRILIVVSCLIFIGLLLWLTVESNTDLSILTNISHFIPAVGLLTVISVSYTHLTLPTIYSV